MIVSVVYPVETYQVKDLGFVLTARRRLENRMPYPRRKDWDGHMDLSCVQQPLLYLEMAEVLQSGEPDDASMDKIVLELKSAHTEFMDRQHLASEA